MYPYSHIRLTITVFCLAINEPYPSTPSSVSLYPLKILNTYASDRTYITSKTSIYGYSLNNLT